MPLRVERFVIGRPVETGSYARMHRTSIIIGNGDGERDLTALAGIKFKIDSGNNRIGKLGVDYFITIGVGGIGICDASSCVFFVTGPTICISVPNSNKITLCRGLWLGFLSML